MIKPKFLIFTVLLLLIAAATGIAFAINNDSKGEDMDKTVLVAYFSRTGEQYSVGNIQKGNTAIIAEMIAEKTNGDLYEIKVVDDNYPNTYDALVQYAKEEKNRSARPEIIGKVPDFDKYKTVFIGYPNWWGDMPMPVYTFLESYDFTGKKVYHFCTHEGSGGVKDGFAIYGHIAQNNPNEAKAKVDEWLNKIGY